MVIILMQDDLLLDLCSIPGHHINPETGCQRSHERYAGMVSHYTTRDSIMRILSGKGPFVEKVLAKYI